MFWFFCFIIIIIILWLAYFLNYFIFCSQEDHRSKNDYVDSKAKNGLSQITLMGQPISRLYYIEDV